MIVRLLTILLILISSSVGMAQTPPADSLISPIRLEIEYLRITDGKVLDTLDILVRTPNHEIGGFDLKIAWPSSYLDILEIIKGELFTECHWELFNGRESFLSVAGMETEPMRLVQVVGLADMAGDTAKPICFSFEQDVTLASLVVTSTLLETMPDTVIPFFFVWEDCSDNTVSDRIGNKLYISKTVADRIAILNLPGENRYPTMRGTPKACLSGSRPNRPIRQIDFINGGFETELVLDTLTK